MDPWHGHLAPTSAQGIALRADRHTWSAVLDEIFDFRRRERAGVLFVRAYPQPDPDLLVGIEWMPVPDDYVRPTAHGLAFDGRFNLRVAERAAELRAGALLVHAHPGHRPPLPSTTDAEHGAAFIAFMRRRHPEQIHGLLIVADHTITGIVDTSRALRAIECVVASGIPTRPWTRVPVATGPGDDEDRQLLAIGAVGQRRLAQATIAVIGNSGGGSHVTQQLIHAGTGTLLVVDPDIVEKTNVRRLVGATRADIDTTPKPDIAVRTAEPPDPRSRSSRSARRFPRRPRSQPCGMPMSSSAASTAGTRVTTSTRSPSATASPTSISVSLWRAPPTNAPCAWEARSPSSRPTGHACVAWA